ncbi:beta-propeller domain-containing protein [Sporosarcina sp. FSL K6-1522]|uniref:beta-propeller domain-containing protein n=1 Tax=Sporosarcina sp. FSL K6-1522 TaxID=2921554 RepID=UPI00315AD1AE
MKKSAIWLIVAVFLTIIVVMVALLIDKVTVTASDIALTEQGWRANFSAPVKATAIGSDDLYVADREGKRVTATITLDNEGKTVHVKRLEPGSYTLHVKKNAVNGKLLKSLPVNEIKFTVHETIESVASAKELQAYFERALAFQESATKKLRFGLENMVSEDSAKSENATSGASDYSATNNQVEGVDEADLVKTDGDFIYTVLGEGTVTITDIRDPQNMRKVTELKMEGEFYPSQLFLHRETLAVLGNRYDYRQPKVKGGPAMDMQPMHGMTTVQLYDVTNPEKPVLLREVGAEGNLTGARKTEDTLYFITSVYPYVWDAATLEGDVLRPSKYDSKVGYATERVAYQDIAILPGAIEPSYSVITAIDLASPAESQFVTKGYLGGSEQLYMSTDNLYLTATMYDAARTMNESMTVWGGGAADTEVFKFTLNGTDVTFQSSATLKGTILNQFSMDEHNGYFRVATTEGNMWDEQAPSKNHLFILDEKLTITGSVEGLAKGERIYSARFMGDKAYMVTFRETDPLFVIDVADPATPKVLGELKIPGFSNYLHPLDANHLIGFGYETVAQKNPGGGEPLITTLGMKISLFDVSDFANPKEKDTEIIGGKGTYSQIQYDHKALFQHKERKLYGFPISIYNETERDGYMDFESSGALVYEITAENGIKLKGDLVTKKSRGEQYVEWEREIQRMLYSKDVLYTISMTDINSYSLDTYEQIGSVGMK